MQGSGLLARWYSLTAAGVLHVETPMAISCADITLIPCCTVHCALSG